MSDSSFSMDESFFSMNETDSSFSMNKIHSLDSKSCHLKQEEPVHKIPDGGLRAWMTVLGGWISLFTTFGSANSFGVFENLYVLEGVSSASNISWIGSTQLCLMFSMGLVSGKLFDAGYFHSSQIVGIVIYLVCTFMLSLAHFDKFYQLFLTQGLGVGIGIGILFLPALAIQGHYWKKRRALAMGLVLTGSAVGGVVYPIMMNQLLFKTNLGFAWSVRIMGFMDTGLLVVAKLLMRTNRPPNRQLVPKPDIIAIITDGPYIIAVLGAFFGLWGLYFPYFYLQLFCNLKGLDPTIGFYSLAIMSAAAVPGRTIPNLLADKYGQFNALSLMSLATGALIFAMFGVKDTAGVIVFALLYGFCSGAFVSLAPPTMAVLAKDVSEIGIRMGLGFFIVGFANLTGTPIVGALLKHDYPWWKAIVFSGSSTTFGAVLIITARQMMVKRKGTNIV
jgi:MFS family permease